MVRMLKEEWQSATTQETTPIHLHARRHSLCAHRVLKRIFLTTSFQPQPFLVTQNRINTKEPNYTPRHHILFSEHNHTNIEYIEKSNVFFDISIVFFGFLNDFSHGLDMNAAIPCTTLGNQGDVMGSPGWLLPL